MRFAKINLIAAAIVLVWSTVAFAQAAMQKKILPAVLQGGDNIYSAFPITTIPFTDFGTTVGYANDYAGNCGNDNGAPDVVYSYTPSYDMLIAAYLCLQSNFDTRLYVFEDNPNNIIACNDDNCSNQYSEYVSMIECLQIFTGHTYYFVIDGYGSASGSYSFDLTLPPPNVMLSGYVTELGDGPLGGANIKVLQNGSQVWQDTTDVSGYYYIIFLNPGTYTVEASKLGYITQTSDPFDLSVCLTAQVNLALQRIGPPPIGAISGFVRERDGTTPIEGGLVRALQGSWEAFRDTTSPEGLYIMPEMQLGLYDVEASKIGYVTQTQYNIEVFADQTTAVDFFMDSVQVFCQYVPGDANGNGTANGIDVTYMVNYLKGIGPVPPDTCNCPPNGLIYSAADANGNCVFNGIDVTYLVNYLKGLGPEPQACPDCPPAIRRSIISPSKWQ
jgi:hypothetical protein